MNIIDLTNQRSETNEARLFLDSLDYDTDSTNPLSCGYNMHVDTDSDNDADFVGFDDFDNDENHSIASFSSRITVLSRYHGNVVMERVFPAPNIDDVVVDEHADTDFNPLADAVLNNNDDVAANIIDLTAFNDDDEYVNDYEYDDEYNDADLYNLKQPWQQFNNDQEIIDLTTIDEENNVVRNNKPQNYSNERSYYPRAAKERKFYFAMCDPEEDL